jgi:hypothetical protein
MTKMADATARDTPIRVVPTCTMQGSPALHRRNA